MRTDHPAPPTVEAADGDDEILLTWVGDPHHAPAGADDGQPPPIDADICHAVAVDLQNTGRGAEAETFYRAALALAPERSDSWSNLGLTVLHDGRAAEAVECQRQALRCDPNSVEAMNNLGIALHALNALAEAENHFRGVLRLAPDHANATLNLGVIRQSLGHPREAELLYRRARALGADAARVGNNLALALAEQGRPEEAEIACREAVEADPEYAEAAVNLGMILLMRGDLLQGWPWYEHRWRVPPLAALPQLPAATRLREVGDLNGKTVLLLGEQGFGDIIQFCRYAPMVARLGAKVILAVPDTLAELTRTLAGVDRVVSQDDTLPEFDLHCPLMSLPGVFGTTEDSIPWQVPYLAAEADAIAQWQREIPVTRGAVPGLTGLRIGLVWAGASRPGQPHAAAIDRRRSMALADMAPLANVPGCSFVSLQLGAAAAQPRDAPIPLLDVADRLTDFAATAALVDALDLVISVDTAVAHLAGALGKPVWLLSRFDACWRWGRDRDDSPWYPTMRLFRQTTPGDWADVMRRVAEALPKFHTFS